MPQRHARTQAHIHNVKLRYYSYTLQISAKAYEEERGREWRKKQEQTMRMAKLQAPFGNQIFMNILAYIFNRMQTNATALQSDPKDYKRKKSSFCLLCTSYTRCIRSVLWILCGHLFRVSIELALSHSLSLSHTQSSTRYTHACSDVIYMSAYIWNGAAKN